MSSLGYPVLTIEAKSEPKPCMTLIPRIYFICSTLYGPCSVWSHCHNLQTRRIKKIFNKLKSLKVAQEKDEMDDDDDDGCDVVW